MTQPPPENPTPDRPTPGQWTPPPAPAPWTPPTPQHAAPEYGTPQHAAAPYESAPQPFTPEPPPAAKRRAPLIASLVAVVALAAGGAVTYVALSDSSDDGGAASPKAAVENVMSDLQNSDLLGVLQDLPPGESQALANPLREDVDKLKELHVLNDSADPNSISGVTFSAKNIAYGTPIPVNDHVQIVQLTGGTVDVTGDASKLPFTDEIRKLQTGATRSSHVHVDLADHAPLRIATVKIGGRWYPSIGYTVADAAAKHKVPTAAQAIAPIGSDSAEDAVRDEITSLLKGDLKSALARISPDELGAVHDYGGMILDQASTYSPTGVSIDTLDLDSTPISGGATKVTLKKLVMSKDGEQITIAIDGSCASLTAQGQTKKICPKDAGDFVTGFLGAFTCFSVDIAGGSSQTPSDCGPDGLKLTSAQKTAIADLFSGVTKLGIAATQSGGQWYLAPLRTYADLAGTLLSGMKGNDLLELAHLGK